MIRIATTLLALAVMVTPMTASAQVTPFGERVNASIDLGLAWLSTQQSGGGWGPPTGLVMLAYLEKRAGADWNSPAVGYAGMEAEVQGKMRDAARYCISIDGFQGDTAISYQTGSCLMALSLFLVTGGPDDVGAPIPVSQAVANAVGALKNNQGRAGAWNYGRPSDAGDMSTTQFAAAGLSAAAALRPDADDTLSDMHDFDDQSQSGDGGFGYRVGSRSTSSMSASGIWTNRLGGRPTSDGHVQNGLRWLQTNYRYDSIIQTNNWPSLYYYLWAAAKALEVTEDDGAGAGIYSNAIGGTRNPVADGYQEESARWFYDFAYYLVTTQTADGRWCQSARCWSPIASQAYSILVLERSLGGVCILDNDDDGLCSTEDNCPEVPNPDQADRDGDGVGDVCDNCINDPNRDQVDDDLDGVGDFCDDIVCIEDGGVDLCDGDDNDCDGIIDEGPPGGSPVAPGDCTTGQSGRCATGTRSCLDGEVACLPTFAPQDEDCDGFDNDCDGLIDEGVTDACGGCDSVPPAETCDGIDDDCDGLVDEEPAGICDDGQICFAGECHFPCDGNECVTGGELCEPDVNLCLGPCDGVDCARGEVCNPVNNNCEDPCDGVDCPGGEVCFGGECGSDSCARVGCPSNMVCNGEECVEDNCGEGLDCPDDTFCREGACVPSCARVACPREQRCVDGQCVGDPCGGVFCPDGDRCIGGICEMDPCVGIGCEPGQYCDNGECIFDPCDNISCPPGQLCENSTAGPQCVNGYRPPPPVQAGIDGGMGGNGGTGGNGGAGNFAGTGGFGAGGPPTTDMGMPGEDDDAGGCNCDIGQPSPSAPWHLLLIAPLFLVGLRRRR